MMILRTSPASPFVRKIRIAVRQLGLQGSVEEVEADTMNAEDTLRVENPLGKIPSLILDNGTVIYDSPVIADYLDGLAGGDKLLPTGFEARIRAKTQEALADGLMDAAVLIAYERRLRDPVHYSAWWVEHQQGKIARALDAFEAEPPTLEPVLRIGAISLACALNYLEFRKIADWRGTYPELSDWLEAFAAAVPSYAETAPV